MNLVEFKNWAMPLALETETHSNIPRLLCITQAAHESGNGNSGLAVNHKNYFGMTAGSDWTGKLAPMETTEYSKLPPEKIRYWNHPGDIKEKLLVHPGLTRLVVVVDFREYEAPLDSFLDWGDKIRLKYPKAYQAAMNLDALGFFHEIAAGGYATDGGYEKKLLSLYVQVQEAV